MERNQTELEGQNAEFFCRLEANPTAITYRWFKGDNQIYDSADYTTDTMFVGQRLAVKKVKKSSAGQYACEGQNTLGTGERKSAYLTVNCKHRFTLFVLYKYLLQLLFKPIYI